MNFAHLHLLLNHIPVVGAPLALAILVYGLLRREPEVERAALLLTVLVALIAIPTYLTGEPAEHFVSGLEGVAKTAISPHEERAEQAFTAMEITGALALFALLLPLEIMGHSWAIVSRPPDRAVRILVAAALGASALLLASTASLGGRIHHPETQMSAPPGGSEGDTDRD